MADSLMENTDELQDFISYFLPSYPAELVFVCLFMFVLFWFVFVEGGGGWEGTPIIFF